MDAAPPPPPTSTRLTDRERVAWLQLIRSENVGPITFHQLLDRYGTATAALDAVPDLTRRGGRSRPVRICPVAEAEQEIAAATACRATVIASCEPDYPALLRHIADAPPIIFVRGNPTVPHAAVAMVGARNASANGLRFARQLAQSLGQHGLAVVSGLARGIDTAAHQGALATGTVAVLAGGVDHIYPPENDGLYHDIVEAGTVISERPPGYRPQARDFPRRNRLISGLALGVIVIEAAMRSGSLITARMAGEQGREVFAVPGSPLDPRAKGTNGLIRNGATLTEETDDVLSVLLPMIERAPENVTALRDNLQFRYRESAQQPESETGYDDGNRQRVLSLLSHTPVDVDELVRHAQLTPAEVMTILLELELAGRINRYTGSRVGLP
jgi:DNA processing protein